MAHRRFSHTSRSTSFMTSSRSRFPDRQDDPLESVSNLFDVAVLVGLGFLIVSLSSFGLRELLSSEDLTVVKSPGTAQMEIITKNQGKIERFTATDQTVSGEGTRIGAVYRLQDGTVVWVPEE